MRRPMQQEEEKVADLTPMLDVVFIMLIFFYSHSNIYQRDRRRSQSAGHKDSRA